MKKELQDKKENIFIHYKNSVQYSIEGLWSSFFKERSFHMYFFCAIFVILLSIFLKISEKDAILVSIIMTIILAIELLNTAIESVVDLVTLEKNPYAKRAKDCASAATFVFVVLGIVLGFIIFLPYINK